MEWLSNMEDTAVERASRLPSEQFFYPNSLETEEDKEEAVAAATDSDALVLTDPDADGLGVIAAVREKHEEVDYISCGPHSRRLDVGDGIDIAIENMNEGASVYIADICPDDIQSIDRLRELVAMAGSVYWWDHHEWNEGKKVFVRNRVDNFVLNEGDYMDSDAPEEKSAAKIAVDELLSEGVDVSQQIQEVVDVIDVYDCWKKHIDEDGEQLTEFIDSRARPLHYYCESVEPDVFVDEIREYGVSLLDRDEVQDAVKQYMDEQGEFAVIAIDRAEWYNVMGYTVCITYGRCPQNEVADYLKRKGCDVIAVVKPSGGVSLRGTERVDWVDEIASEFDGGGHAKAASFFVAPKNDGDDERWDTDMLDYADHWLSNGKRTRDKVREKIVASIREREVTSSPS